MPSRAEPVRARLEWVARVAAFALLAWALWRQFTPAPVATRVLDSASLARTLGAVLSVDGRTSVPTHVRVTGAVLPPVRDVVAAAQRAGARVSWSGDSATVWAAAGAPEREPGGGVRVAVVGPAARDDSGVLADTTGALDTLRLRDGGAAVTLSPARGLQLRARGAAIALNAAPDTAPWRALVLARAGWEAKFVVAALEEQGWTVSARLSLAPGTDVTQGALPALDPAALDVVVVLDSVRVGPETAAIVRFVRAGGGIVLAGDGAIQLRAMAPAELLSASTRAPRSEAVVTRVSLPLRALTNLRADAVVLESRGPLVAAAARSEGRGRVILLGYGDTWRWRMAGGATAVAEHRRFWSQALAGVAPDRAPLPAAPEGAPRARLVDAWGAMSAAPATPSDGSTARWLWPLAALLLVAEWASRRTRGAA